MSDTPGVNRSRRTFLKGTAGIAAGTVAAELAGFGIDVRAFAAKAGEVPIKKGKEVPSVCPYCAVGCGQIVMVDTGTGKILDIQGNPDSPISQGTLCPKGAATYQLAVNPLRWTKVKYRAPLSDHWEEKPLDWAMERIAQLVKKTRDADFNEFQEMPDTKGGTVRKRVMNTYAIASLGGATMDKSGITSTRSSCTPWGSCTSKTRHGYDTPPRSPVWGSPSVEAVPPPSLETSSTPTRF